ncbi:DUF1707 domain-containing protein [Kibdelosporangium persicum]|uniref:DUF1707 domain-containing protein n=1 Tax=Kibdelosporangium persicum TaxID=2698649 RepID=A0ABX2F175_9PSEU|nr:DUF1707 domain-containing protein [Kibdelosporangium persicum]NRN64745.1 hypothetical protein [Kibdelosporangium persicum]
MSDPEIRVGDAEREEALQALGDHMSAGRLDIDEYGERTARVAASKTRGELLELFRDLPDPKPAFFPQVKVHAQALPATAAPAPRRWSTSRAALKAYAALIPVVWVATALLFLFAVRNPFVFLLPVFVMIAGARIWGEEWHNERRAQRRQREHWKNEHRRHRGRY